MFAALLQTRGKPCGPQRGDNLGRLRSFQREPKTKKALMRHAGTAHTASTQRSVPHALLVLYTLPPHFRWGATPAAPHVPRLYAARHSRRSKPTGWLCLEQLNKLLQQKNTRNAHIPCPDTMRMRTHTDTQSRNCETLARASPKVSWPSLGFSSTSSSTR